MGKQDDLIAVEAAKLQKIYDERTAGDHTFTGVLTEFALRFVRAHEEVKLREFQARFIDEEKEWPPLDLTAVNSQLTTISRSMMCRCGDYFATSERDLDAHVEAMMCVEDGKSHG